MKTKKVSFYYLVLNLVLMVFLGACSLLKQEPPPPPPCIPTTWVPLGEQDARDGELKTHINVRAKKCKMTEILTNVDEYLAGYKLGLEAYCTAENGYQEGVAGHEYKNICPAEKETLFLKNYRLGYELFRIRSSIENIKHRIDDIKDSIDHNNSTMSSTQSSVNSLKSDYSTQELKIFSLNSGAKDYEESKAKLVNGLKDITDQIATKEKSIKELKEKNTHYLSEIHDLERELGEKSVELANYQHKLETRLNQTPQAQPSTTHKP